MPSDLESYLLDRQEEHVSDDKLRDIAMLATAAYVGGGVPLNDTLRGKVKEAGLNQEQIKRVVEHANVATNLALFKRGVDKNIVFPVADVAAVACDGGVTKVAAFTGFGGYAPRRKYVPGEESVSFGRAFGQLGEEKTAAAPTAGVSHKLAILHRTATDQAETLVGLGVEYETKLAHLRAAVDAALADGDVPFTVGAAVEMARPKTPGLKAVLAEEFGDNIEYGGHLKLAAAGAMMMPNNPVTGLTQDLDQIAAKMMSASAALEQTRMAMGGLLQILQGPPPVQPTAELFQQQGQVPPHAQQQMQQAGPPQGQPEGA